MLDGLSRSMRGSTQNIPDFERMFIDQYAPLDDKNAARDKLQELQ